MTSRSTAFAEEMIFKLKGHFEKIPEHRAPQAKIPLQDALMSAYAMFALKFPSLLEFEEERRAEGATGSNLKTIFQIGQVPSDTQMREIVDEVVPSSLHKIFPDILNWVQSKKLLKPYGYFKRTTSYRPVWISDQNSLDS